MGCWVHDLKKKMTGGRWTHEEGVLHITYNIRTSGNMFCIKLFFSRKSVQNIYVLKLAIQQLFYISMQCMGSMQSKQLDNSWQRNEIGVSNENCLFLLSISQALKIFMPICY